MIRILHLLSQHPESTGSGYYIRNIIKQADLAGHRNYLLAGTSDFRQFSLGPHLQSSSSFVNFGSGDLAFPIPGMSDVMPYPSSRFADLNRHQLEAYETSWAQAITKAAQGFNPTLIHSHHLWIMSSIARRVLPKIPMVTSCHSTDLRQFVLCPHLQQQVTAGCISIDRILALSRSQANEIEKLLSIPHNRINVVGGGFDSTFFRLKEKSPCPPVNLLYGGKLSLAKGVDWLLRTYGSMDTSNLHLHLAGSGTGDEEKRCLELATQLGNKVTVHGRLSQQEFATLMTRCHIFILPSFYEGLPLVLLEALASGCRIITTNLPGSIELLEDVSPKLVDFIQLPTLDSVDRPQEKDIPTLNYKLAESIYGMAAEVLNENTPPESEIAKVTSRFHWNQVFRRIECSYNEVATAG